MQTSLCSRCVAYLQKGGGRGCCLLLLARPAPLSTGGRRKTGGSFLRWKSSSRKTKKEEEPMHCEVPTEGGGLLAMDFPLEGKTSKPNYTATVGGALPLSIDAESHKSSAAGRFYLHHSEEGGVVPLPSVTTSGCAPVHVITHHKCTCVYATAASSITTLAVSQGSPHSHPICISHSPCLAAPPPSSCISAVSSCLAAPPPPVCQLSVVVLQPLPLLHISCQ